METAQHRHRALRSIACALPKYADPVRERIDALIECLGGTDDARWTRWLRWLVNGADQEVPIESPLALHTPI